MNCQQHRKIGGRLGDFNAAHRMQKHILIETGNACMPVYFRQQQCEPVLLKPDREPARIGHMRGIDQGLNFDQQRTRASCVTSTHDPGTACGWCDKKSADGLDTPRRPRSVIAKTPSSLTAPKRFLNARTSREVECDSPSKYRTVSTICSSTRGPARLPSLVTCPTMMIVTQDCLASRVSCAAHSRTCATDPGAELSASE